MASATRRPEPHDLGKITLRPGRCVHEHATVATCRACVDACPTGAWLLDNDQLALDTALCDGCGLCAGVCPTGALAGTTLGSHAANRPLAEPVLDLACERAVPAGQATLSCLHATSPRELADVQRRGVRRLEVCAAPCDDDATACARYGRSPTLEAMLAAVNALLAAVGEPPLRLVRRPPGEWARVTARRRAGQTLPNAGRRALFRRLGAAAEPTPSTAATASDDAHAALVARLSPAAPHPLVPTIDTERCVACHACARLCPTGALALGRDATGLHYRISPAQCTGCDLCHDSCAHAAVRVARSSPRRQATVPLAEHRCVTCGVVFHVPAATPEAAVEPNRARCRICRVAPASRRLYQVQA